MSNHGAESSRSGWVCQLRLIGLPGKDPDLFYIAVSVAEGIRAIAGMLRKFKPVSRGLDQTVFFLDDVFSRDLDGRANVVGGICNC